jgi:flagellar motor switch protein FliM
MSSRFHQELAEELAQTKRIEIKGKLHPKRQIKYTSRIHTIRENRDLIIFFGTIILGYAFMALLVVWMIVGAIHL